MRIAASNKSYTHDRKVMPNVSLQCIATGKLYEPGVTIISYNKSRKLVDLIMLYKKSLK